MRLRFSIRTTLVAVAATGALLGGYRVGCQRARAIADAEIESMLTSFGEVYDVRDLTEHLKADRLAADIEDHVLGPHATAQGGACAVRTLRDGRIVVLAYLDSQPYVAAYIKRRREALPR